MKLKICRIQALLLIGASATIALSCASGPEPKKQEAWPESKRDDWEHNSSSDPCAGKDGEPVHCTSNEDCCKGFSCSIDPSRSRVIRYCLEG